MTGAEMADAFIAGKKHPQHDLPPAPPAIFKIYGHQTACRPELWIGGNS